MQIIRSYKSSCAACASILCKNSSICNAPHQLQASNSLFVPKVKCTAGGASLVPAVITLKAVSPDAGVAILGTGVQLYMQARRAHADAILQPVVN